MANENQTTILRDLTFFWAKLDKPVETPFGTTIYDLQVRFPKKRVKEMSAYGKVKPQDDGSFSINITRKPTNAKGQETPVRVVDEVKRPLEGKIGNGSKGNIIVYQYDWNVAGKSGTKTILVAVQVTEFIEYKEESSIDFDIIGTGQAAEEAKADF
jgi:hypothetical protein